MSEPSAATSPLEPRPLLVAVASQNWRRVTPHAGRTRRFLLFTAEPEGAVAAAGRFDLPRCMAVHGWPAGRPHPLEACDIVVAASAGAGFQRRMKAAGVRVVVAASEDPQEAAAAAVARGGADSAR